MLGSERGFQHRPSIEKVDFRAVFDVLFWHFFVLIFLHRRTKIISIYILVPVPSVNNYSIMEENWQEFTTSGRVYKM